MSSDEVIGKTEINLEKCYYSGKIDLQSYCITVFVDSQNVKTDSQKIN